MGSQPGALVLPVWAVSFDQRPERSGVVRDTQMAELVHDDVVDHCQGREDQPPVERERALRRTRAPQRPLGSDPDPLIRDPETFGPFLGKCRDDLTRLDTRLGLADEETLETEPRNLSAPLFLDPAAPLLE